MSSIQAISSNVNVSNIVSNNQPQDQDVIAEFQERVTELQSELQQLLALGPNISATTFQNQYEFLLSQIESTMNGGDGNGPGLTDLLGTLKKEASDPQHYPDVAAFVQNTGGAFTPFMSLVMSGSEGEIGSLADAAASGDADLSTFLSTTTFQKNETFLHNLQMYSQKVNP